MDQSSRMHTAKCTRERDRDAQKLSYIQWPAEQSIEGCATRVLEDKHRAPIATCEGKRPHRPQGIKLTCQRVFVLEPIDIRW
jgi:hypothetical protein